MAGPKIETLAEPTFPAADHIPYLPHPHDDAAVVAVFPADGRRTFPPSPSPFPLPPASAQQIILLTASWQRRLVRLHLASGVIVLLSVARLLLQQMLGTGSWL